jgi:hypothetical protein
MLFFISKILLNFVFAAPFQCPELRLSIAPNNLQSQSNQGLDCRTKCLKNEDCTVELDPCGRRMAIHSKYKNEVKEAFKKADSNECPFITEIPLIEKAHCVKLKCQVIPVSCEVAKQQLEKFSSKSFPDQCKVDKDCSFIIHPVGPCFKRLPLNVLGITPSKEFEFNYLKERVVKSCNILKANFCDTKKTSQCISNTCVQLEKKMTQKPYLNYEGPEHRAHYNSRTEPLMVPSRDEIICKSQSDCKSVSGICGQYAVALNKEHYSMFKEKIEEKERSIACPVVGAFSLPLPDCVNNFCVFQQSGE